MTFLPISTIDELGPGARSALDRELGVHDEPVSTTQLTLLGHVPSFTAYAAWAALRDELQPYIGERAVSLLSYSISEEADALIGTTYFRRLLVDAGEDLDNPQLTETEQLLMDWGRRIAAGPGQIPDDMYARLERAFNPKLRLMLVAFAGQLVALNLFTTVGRVPLDESLYSYRRPGDTRTA